ncbi:hypothetical protein ACTXG6_10370 [Pseudonocardia sp. Cha107L01]|uniref:hypothetical protein n=1 Tax=Pseudonocardia sp. Cha107L01 TaxID=3457576 RepID=UPI00403EAD4B
MDLDGTADALYALPRADFTPARDERVKEARSAGDKALAASIGKLRRPTVAAWLVNNLARQRPDEITGLAELGEQLRAAHEQLDGAALRRLSEQRRELINALTRTTRELGAVAGEEVSETVSRELEGMFTSALTDPDAARALASGRLSSPKELASASTLDWPATAPGARPRPAPSAAPADVTPGTEAAPRSASAAGSRTGTASHTGAAASRTDTDSGAGAAPAGTPPRPADRPNPALARARQELERLTEALSEARAGAEAAHRDYDEAAAEEAAAHQAVADRRAELIAAEQAEQRARQRARAARRDREDTDRALRDADRRHGVARDRLTALEH